MLILLASFLILLGFLGWIGSFPILTTTISIPFESLALRHDIKKSLKKTEVPDYVFKYGTHSLDASLKLSANTICSTISTFG